MLWFNVNVNWIILLQLDLKHIHKAHLYPSDNNSTQALLVMLVTNMTSESHHYFPFLRFTEWIFFIPDQISRWRIFELKYDLTNATFLTLSDAVLMAWVLSLRFSSGFPLFGPQVYVRSQCEPNWEIQQLTLGFSYILGTEAQLDLWRNAPLNIHLWKIHSLIWLVTNFNLVEPKLCW